MLLATDHTQNELLSAICMGQVATIVPSIVVFGLLGSESTDSCCIYKLRKVMLGSSTRCSSAQTAITIEEYGLQALTLDLSHRGMVQPQALAQHRLPLACCNSTKVHDYTGGKEPMCMYDGTQPHTLLCECH